MLEISLENFLPAFFLTVFAGLSTGIGALLAFFSKSKSHTFLSIGLGFSAGVMVYVSFVEILAKSRKAFEVLYQSEIIGESLAIVCFFAGIGLSALIDRFIPEDVNPHEPKSDKQLSVLKDSSQHSVLKNSALKRTGVFTALAIGIHNFPEGFATFMAALDDVSLGIPIALAIAVHNIPEGMAVSLPIYHATGERKKAFWYAFISGLAEPVGAIVGFFLLLPLMGELTFGITFGCVAGIMVYISFDELLPSSRLYGNSHTTILGITLGMLVMAISLVGFKLL